MKGQFESRSDLGHDVDTSGTKRFERIVIAALVVAIVAGVGIGGFQAAAMLKPQGTSQLAQHQEGQSSVEEPENTAAASAPETRITSGLIVDETGQGADAFALWVRGRLSLTGTDGSDLLVELGPAQGRVDIWGTLGVDGDAVVTGAIGSQNVDASSGSFEKLDAAAAMVDSLVGKFGSLDSLSSTDLLTENAAVTSASIAQLIAERAALAEASVTALEVQNASVQDISAVLAHTETLVAGVLEAATIDADTASIDVLEAEEVGVRALDARAVDADTAHIETLDADTLSFTDAVGGSLALETLKAGAAELSEIRADAFSTSTLSAGSALLDTLTVQENTQLNALSAGSIVAGSVSCVLESLRVSASSCASVTFPAIAADGSGFIERRSIDVPEGTSAVFLSPEYSGGEWICAWEVERRTDTGFDIVRRFPARAKEQMEAGEFEPMPEVRVFWLAVSAR